MSGPVKYQLVLAGGPPNLPLPDGREVSKLKLSELWPLMAGLAIPGINASMGKQALIDAYKAAVHARVEAMAADEPIRVASQEVLRRAAEAIAADATGNVAKSAEAQRAAR